MKKEKDIPLPPWFDGEVYDKGALVENPYSGQSCELTPNELAMYDLVKGSEKLITLGDKSTALNKVFYDALWWFKDNSPEKYMILLD